MPGIAVSVVNWYEATRDLAFVSLFRRVDLPTLGRPIRTTVASPAFRTSKPAFSPPVCMVRPWMFASCSRFSLAILALSRPTWNSVALFIWVLWISSCMALIFSGMPIGYDIWVDREAIKILSNKRRAALAAKVRAGQVLGFAFWAGTGGLRRGKAGLAGC